MALGSDETLATLPSPRVRPQSHLEGGLSMALVRKWLFPIVSASFVSIVIFFSVLSGFTTSFVFFASQASPAEICRGPAHLPAFAYYISGGRGDGGRMLRLLLSVYHPRNTYLLHLSSDAPDAERDELAFSVRLISAVRVFDNVDVVKKASSMTPMGSSGLAAALHAASTLLRLDGSWDWFVTLSASDYPLVTQDDMIHAFSSVPRDLNFVDHTSDLGWKEKQRVQPIIVDAGIYLSKRNNFFQASKKRATPNSFKFFTGSPWVTLSRPFIEYCVLGWDNIPRTLLMYFTNVILPQEGYFHSVICNSHEFKDKTVNSDLRYMVWDHPPKMEPRFLNSTDYDQMIESGMAFARHFHKDERVLDKIDKEILKRRNHKTVPGAWCSSRKRSSMDQCARWGNANIVRPGPQSEKFAQLLKRLLDDRAKTSSCSISWLS